MKEFFARFRIWFQAGIAPSLPGTGGFFIRFRNAVVQNLRSRMDVYNNLTSLEEGIHHKLYRKVRAHYKIIAVSDSVAEVYPQAIGEVVGVFIMIGFVLIPFFAAFSFHVRSPWLYSLLSFLVTSFLTGYIWLQLLNAFMRVYDKNIFLYYVIFIFFALICWGLYVLLHSVAAIWWGYLLMVVLIGTFMGIAALTLLLTGTVLGLVVFLSGWEKKHPDSYLVTNYVAALYTLEQNKDEWTRPDLKQHIFGLLEANAKVASSSFLNMFRIVDPVVKPWFIQKAQGISAATQNLAKTVLFPGSSSYQELIDSIGKIVVCFVDGNWGGIETAEPEKVTRPQRIVLVLNSLKMLLLSLLPIAVVWYLQQSKLALQPPISDYLVAGALVWALLVILNIFDPNLIQRIGALKDVAGLISPVSKK